MHTYAGADWLQAQLAIRPIPAMHGCPISPLGVRVADLLGDLWRGFYHWHREWRRVDWSHDRWIEVRISKNALDCSTWDGSGLTTLVLLCHQRCLRVTIDPAGSLYLRLTFFLRQRTGSTYERHPTIQEAIARFTQEYGAGEESEDDGG